MKHIFNYILILIFCVSSIQQTFCQVRVTIAKKDYLIPAFIKDTTTGEYGKDLLLFGINSRVLNYAHVKSDPKDLIEQLGLLEAIQNSLYDIEVRLYNISPFFSGSVIVVKGNQKKLTAEYYEFSRFKAVPGRPYKMKEISRMTYYYYQGSLSVSDTLLTSLIKNKLFNYDPVVVRNNLKKAGKETRVKTGLDYSKPTIYIKVKNDIHFISCDPDALEINKGETEVAPETLITHTLYNLAKQLNK